MDRERMQTPSEVCLVMPPKCVTNDFVSIFYAPLGFDQISSLILVPGRYSMLRGTRFTAIILHDEYEIGRPCRNHLR